MTRRFKLAIFASGSGTNAEEIFKYFKHHASIEVVLLLSNNPEAYALQRATNYGIETKIFNRLEFKESTLVLEWLQEREVTHVVLAGFLWLIPVYLIEAYPDRIINIHPALLPKYGGKGMYGMKVHEAVHLAKDVETGITIHLVNDQYDSGEIIFQGRCPIPPDASPDDIAKSVHQLEYKYYPAMIEKWVLGNL
jgi:phosphoribosylglycinamide formyltransferase-1